MSFNIFRLSFRNLFVGLVCAFAITTPLKADEVGDMSVDELKQFIQDYLMENPEVIISSLETFQRRQEALTTQYQTEALSNFIAQAKVSTDFPTTGPSDADVTVIEFFDYQCGYCKRAFPDMMEMVEDDGNVRVIFVELPILGPASRMAALAALSADKQDKYMEFHTTMMELRGQLTEDKIYDVADDIGMDIDQLKSDMRSEEFQILLNGNTRAAEMLGVTGTPAFIIGDQIYKGAIPRDQMEIAVRQHREINS